jgi:hypothetical protein
MIWAGLLTLLVLNILCFGLDCSRYSYWTFYDLGWTANGTRTEHFMILAGLLTLLVLNILWFGLDC